MSRIVLPQLPLEITIDILSRLPVKPLFRFKCVCKSWLSLISNNPEFAKLHLRYATQDTTLNRYQLFLSTYPFQSIDHDAYCHSGNVVKRELSYPDAAMETSYDLEFIGSSNGLIAIALSSDSYIIVWNPTTGDSRALPASESSMSGKSFFGFGYDSRLNDYKVVRGAVIANTCEIKMEVFNLKGNTWRSINNLHINISLTDSRHSPISIDGFLHWLVEVTDENYSDQVGIVSFDLAEEKFMEMVPVPDYLIQEYGPKSLIIERVGENVCVCSHWYSLCYEAWIMKKDGREISWRKLYSFNSLPFPGCKYSLRVLWVAKNGNVLFDVDGRRLLLYNPEEESFNEYEINWDVFEIFTYVETLISPNST